MRLTSNVGGIFRVADFGCGTGENTLVVANTIVNAVQRSFEEHEIPEFEVYFIDLACNDFNSLFRMLPPHRPDYADVDNGGDKNPLAGRSYIAAAVCGSHFRRLVSRKSLHFYHSSTSLHWLSRVPESVQQRRSPRVYVSGDFEESVGAAYLVQQFDKDFTAFLKARAEELVDGGCMFVSLPGRNEGTHMMEEQGICGFVARQIECAFEELVNEGIVEKEKWESFKIPFFGSNSDEEESIVKKEGSFVLKFVKTLEGIYPYCMIDFERGEENIFGRLIANNYRAAFENIVETHLGCKRSTEELFFRIGKRASILIEEYLSKETKLVVAFLIKKGVHNKTY
ncbi:indole-3-acetate O-methyltransferase 1 isoform X1 [Cryptomeria japonica]|uniref:indole-3-acetate O-methyltransferase 1 isoform X1 n=1 Tax=Cryptomeria japonica TaxID=3369 RepID=UPI0027D9F42C|nr:indole-3-acetate O-methyltransferase 1 isoform X1 [Cryptomeria japonica]XP_057864400.2 indole-3-acetate O-methyltransferase 1 isoform X1 [Cryptomeria japonica]XP_059077712.1 indole-3-acetate O-methyltransferase 1 isoform X1 [Cryptomeria japonica]XP_059077713.1 indole-3-acetate O-methyltransferase 1 isoform X1 [Cryptomeria japonica]